MYAHNYYYISNGGNIIIIKDENIHTILYVMSLSVIQYVRLDLPIVHSLLVYATLVALNEIIHARHVFIAL